MNPIVAAHISGQNMENAEFSHVQLFEALLWACEHNDIVLWEYLQTTPLDVQAAKELPLITAIKHNSFDIGEQLAPLFKEYIFKAVKIFLWSRSDNTLKDPPQRARWLSMLLPNSSCTYLEKNLISQSEGEKYKDLSYFMILLSPEELDTIPLLQFEKMAEPKTVQRNMYILMGFGLHWSYFLKHKGLGFMDPVEKTQWFCNKFAESIPHSNGSFQLLFKDAYIYMCFGSARVLNEHDPECIIPCNVLHEILMNNPLETCIQALLVQPNAPYSQENLKKVFKNLEDEKYGVQLTNHTKEADHAVLNALLPYLEKSSVETQNQFWEAFTKKASPSIAGYINTLKSNGANIPDLHWDKNVHNANLNIFEDLSLEPAPHDLNFRLKQVEQSACSNTSLFDLPVEHLIEPKMFAAIAKSGNTVLIEKALECGASIDIPLFNQICLNASPEVKQRIFEKHVYSQVDLSEIINQLGVAWEPILCSKFKLEVCYQPDVIEKLQDHATTELATYAIKNRRLDLLERVLVVETSPKDIWDLCATLEDSVFCQQVLDLLITHLDPWFENCEPLLLAVKRNNLPMVERLVEVCDPRANNSEALVWASANGNCEMVKFLLNYCPAKIQNWQALHWAVTNGHKDVAVVLLREGPVPPTWAKRFNDEKRSELFQECQDIVQAERMEKELEDLGRSNSKRVM